MCAKKIRFKCDIPNYRRPILGVSHSEHVDDKFAKAKVSADGGDSCVARCNNLCQKLDCDRVCDLAFTIFLTLYITPRIDLNILVSYSLKFSIMLLHLI